MMKRFLTIAMAALMTTAALAQTQTPKPAAAKSKTVAMLQGTWIFTMVNGGDASGGPEITVTITDDKYVQTVAGEVVERGSYKLDESKKPMTMDLMITEGDSSGKTQLGVFEVNETTMRGKMSTAGENVRPTDLTPEADGTFAFTATKKK